MMKSILYGALGFSLAALLAGSGYYFGREATGGRSAQAREAASVSTPQPEPTKSSPASKIVGVWAFADGGCATGYGAGYNADGRFSEGDEFSGVEGRWAISGGQLIRETTLRYELDESARSGARPAVTRIHQTSRFPIIRLTSAELVIDDHGKRFSYVACAGGKRMFVDGPKSGPL